jgi:hypothetical protein
MIDLSVELVVLVYPQLGVGKRMKKEIISMLLGDIGLVSDKDIFRSDRYPEFHV